MDSYLQYVGGSAGAIALAGIAAASALYFATRPTPEKPLVPLHEQSPVLEVSKKPWTCVVNATDIFAVFVSKAKKKLDEKQKFQAKHVCFHKSI